jgi:hypothetical protein
MSMLFNAAFYLKEYPDVLGAIAQKKFATAEDHWNAFGAAELRNPNAFFNTKDYFNSNPDVLTSGMNPLDHFLKFGASEGRSPSASFVTKAQFDTAAYAKANTDLATAGITTPAALYEHFAKFGFSETRPGVQTTNGVAITDGVAGGAVGTTLTLTTGSDNIVGDAGNNTIDGSAFLSGGIFVPTLNNSDKVDGAGGLDTLLVQSGPNAVTMTPSSVKNVEAVSVEATAAMTLNLINGDAAIKTLNNQNSTANATVNNLQGALSNLNVSNTANNTTVTIASTALAGATDALAVNLTGVTGGTISVAPSAAGSGYETVNLKSDGALANTTTLTDGAGTSLASVNVTGAAALTLALADTSVTTLDASAMTAALTATVAGASGAQSIKGGTAGDVINMAGTYTSADTIDGGAGSDRLTLTNAEAIAATTAQTRVTNIETIGLSNGLSGTVSVANFNATGLRFGANMAAAGVVNYAAGDKNTLDLQTFASGGANLVANIAGTATNDVLGITAGSTTAGNTFGAGTVTINGAEVVNLTSQGGANTFGAAFALTDTAATQALNILGNQNITFTGAVRADTVDASGMTGTGALALNGGTGTTATAITGTGNADILIGSTAGDIINAGAGNDAIFNAVNGTAATAFDQLTGGAGNDTFTLTGSAAVGASVAIDLNTASFITDFSVSGGDILALSSDAGDYGSVSAFDNGITAATAVAAGATVIQSVTQNAAATAILTGTDLLKVTTGVATAGLTLEQAFDAAIGSASITALNANGDDMFFTLYDTTNGRVIIGAIDDSNADSTFTAADTVSIIGSATMSATDYAAFGSADFALIA